MPRNATPLDALAESWLETLLALTPELHVELGRPGREGEYSDLSPDGHAARAEAMRETLRHVERTEVHDEEDEVTRAELQRTLGLALARHEAGEWRRDLDTMDSPVSAVRDVFDLMPTDTADDWAAVAVRLANVPAALAGYVASLRSGMEHRQTPAVRQVHAVAGQAERLAGDASFFTTLVARADVPGPLLHDLERGVAAARAAYASVQTFLRAELAPVARAEDGFGRERYALASEQFIGVAVDLDETYEWGLDELSRITAEQEVVAAQIVPGGTLSAAVASLDSDPGRSLHGTEALRAWMQERSDHALDALGGTHFDVPPLLRRLECCIAPTQEGGIDYPPPSEDFSRPGRMWWSVPEGVEQFTTWQELSTVYHEGVPGHHLQLGTAMLETDRLNAWRRLSWNSGHGEGWALYAERLMADLGFLDDPGDRFGMLDAQRIRAARVVIDIGVHLGKPHPDGDGTWTGDRAFEFLARHWTAPEPYVRHEVLRYLGWAGQAPSYKVGQRLWEQLRDDWSRAHGSDLREFHRQALGHGSIGMGTLRDVLLRGTDSAPR